MFNPIQNAAIFLINTIFGIYVTLVLLRFILQILQINFYNPICQVILKITNPCIIPLRKFIPSILFIDTSSLVLLFILKLMQITLLTFVVTGSLFSINASSIFGILLLITGQLLELTITIFTFTIFIYVILSWFPQTAHNPILNTIYSINDPILRPFRKKLPLISGMDFSPILVLILLQLVNFLLIDPIIYYAKFMML